jgi:hypothetical protein
MDNQLHRQISLSPGQRGYYEFQLSVCAVRTRA